MRACRCRQVPTNRRISLERRLPLSYAQQIETTGFISKAILWDPIRSPSSESAQLSLNPQGCQNVQDVGTENMATTYLVRRWGCGVDNPSESDMRAALSELATEDEEHPDCWLSDENGWHIAAFGSGLVILENPETNEGPWHMIAQSHDSILHLWVLLQSGKMDEIRGKPWTNGYGQ